jgi:hypothetical protein
MKALIAACLLCTAPAAADTLSADIGRQGITATLAQLDQLSREQTEAERFTMGGLRFLAAIESALQLQWRTGMDQSMGGIGGTLGLPLLRLPLPPNPAPEPFQGSMVTELFANITKGMQAARVDLDTIPEGADFGVEIAFSDLWFDVNANQARDPGEDAAELLGPQLLGWQWAERDASLPLPVIRFDGADAAWLSAYTHLLEGISEVILTYDPAAAIDRMIATRAALGVVPPPPETESFNFDFEAVTDALAVIEGALNQTPDATHAKAAKAHFLAMVADNRRFWTMVALEKDNDREWIPNDAQISALGFELPPGTGARWLAVLADGEALLQGRVLIPYWRGAAGQGINFGKLFDDPRPFSLTGWIQGWGVVPYLEKGPVVSGENLFRFEEMMLGNAGLMMVFLN